MLQNIFGFQFDVPEFIFGLALGFLVYFGVTRAIPLTKELLTWGRGQVSQVSVAVPTPGRDRYRREIATYAQGHHLARNLFFLEDIAVVPRVLAPPFPADPSNADPRPESTLAVIPNLPDWVMLSGIFATPSLTLPEALEHGPNLLITGEPGAGKSTALAYMALLAATRSKDAGAFADYAPFLVHAYDLKLDRWGGSDPQEPLVWAAQATVSGGMGGRLPGYVRQTFRQKNALVLLDGLDELNLDEISRVAAWLEALQEDHPEVRILAAGPARGYDGVVGQGRLAPAALAPWTDHDQRTFMARWAGAWQRDVAPKLPKGRLADIDPALITGWIVGSTRGATPLELTMRVWASHMGDVRGISLINSFDAYLARILSPEERQAAEAAGLAWLNARSGLLPDRSLPRGTPTGDLVNAGVLRRRDGGNYSFSQPAIGAFLGARAMAASGPSDAVVQGGWPPAELAIGYLAAMTDAGKIAQRWMEAGRDSLETGALDSARLLRYAPQKAAWRQTVLRALAQIVQSHQRPYGLRLRAVHALVQAEEPTAAILFRRLLTADAASTRILSAIGLGGLRDEESVSTLVGVMSHDRELLVRQAACLGLAGVGTDAAMEALGRVLLEGEEGVRLAAAEALACIPDEGHSMLRDAAEVNNLMTRRAAVFGLARVYEDWALELLDKVQVDDEQWVVRGAAAEAATRRRTTPWRIPEPVREPSELPWLIAFAARVGSGITPGRPAMEMLRRALSSGSTEEKIAALETLAWLDSDEFQMEFNQALRSDEPFLRDAAFETLWRQAAPGVLIVPTAT
ncbi:MAG TPA: HEAT repeat domain-containing protein [Anaerolineales bacterium]|nr:HEAT repeat domain-containing protein [Anaerolineales bacterium]